MDELKQERKETLFYSVIMAAALDDEDQDTLIELLKPEGKTEEQLGCDFETAIGYNPITYCDREKATSVIEHLTEVFPDLKGKIEDISDDIYEAVETAVREGKNQTIGETVLDTVLGLVNDDDLDVQELADAISKKLDLDPDSLFDPDEDSLNAEKFLSTDEDDDPYDNEPYDDDENDEEE